PDYAGETDFSKLFVNPAIGPRMSERDRRHLVALYDGEIRWTDDTIAGILADLDAAGLLRRSVVVVTADHGEEFFEHGGKAPRQTLYDEVLRVPLVVAWPGGPPLRRRSEEVVSLVDVAPAVCRWLGLSCADLGPGSPLVEAARPDHDPGRDDALAHLVRGRTGSDRAWVGHHGKVVERREGTIEFFGPPTYPASDLEPAEKLSREELGLATKTAADSVQTMDARVAEARRRGDLLHPSAPHPTVSIDDATRARLESLGYLPTEAGKP
ncbi:MAG: sulfatase-like hydrolase/transferase, partial [Alphaproteobacteria bacterium]